MSALVSVVVRPNEFLASLGALEDARQELRQGGSVMSPDKVTVAEKFAAFSDLGVQIPW